MRWLLWGLAGCGTPTTPTAVVSPPPSTVTPGLPWETCGAAECLTVQVPLEPGVSDGETLGIRVARAAATGPSEGVLFLNLGGFGAPGVGPMQDGLAGVFPRLNERFDLIAWDPRGSGESAPLDCVDGLEGVLDLGGRADTSDDLVDQVEVRQVVVDDCRADHANVMPRLGYLDHADDLEAVRAGLGVDRLHFFGFSAGTALGQVYADRYPERVDRMALDSVASPFGGMTGLAESQLLGLDEVLADFDAWCRAAADDCAVSEDPLAAVFAVLDDAAEDPLFVNGRPLTYVRAAYGMMEVLYDPSSYSLLATAAANHAADDGFLLASLSEDFAQGPPPYAPWILGYTFNLCADELVSPSPEDLLAFADLHAERPFAGVFAAELAWCTAYGTSTRPVLAPPSAPVETPILLLNGATDFATPLDGALDVADDLQNAVLVTHAGSGHIVWDRSSCMRTVLREYLLEGVVPEDGLICE